ncbi:FtsX-like permease family protein [Promethearchaeum syntrophicum]|uniref:FtsX-like permease family protein n=1 Tax=Promethearchaeum syntrophicum TaxID=2594042 RepID=A0A5B9DFI7_9ARCH
MKSKLFFKFMRKKKEIWVITGLLIISITFLMGVLYSTNAFRSHSMMNTINQYPTDFYIESNNWNSSDEFLTSYFSNYEGPLEINQTYPTEDINLDNVKIEGDNISDTGVLINQLNRSYNLVHLVGIDESAYNLLNSKDMQSKFFFSEPINFSSTGIYFSNLLRESQVILTDMRLNIFTEANTSEDGDIYPLNLNFTNINTSVDNSVSVDGYFNVYDIEFFYRVLGISSGGFDTYPILLGNLDTINVLFPNSTDNIIHVSSDQITNIVFNKTKLSEYSPTKIVQELNTLDLALDNYKEDYSVRGRGTWVNEISHLLTYNLAFELISIILFIPIIIICYSYFKISYYFMISKRKREIGMCLVNGMNRKQIKIQYYWSAIISGLIGGIIGNIGGLILSKKIGEFLFPNILLSFTKDIILNFILNSIVASIIAALISLIAVRKPLKQIVNQKLENVLETKKNELEKPKEIKQLEWILFGGCIYAFFFSIIQSLFFESFDFKNLTKNPPLMFIALIIAIPFLPIFMYVFPSILLKILLNKFKGISRKIAELKILKKNQFKMKLMFWNWNQKSDRNKKLIKVSSFSVIFIFMTSILTASYNYSNIVYESSRTANANRVDLEFWENINITSINNFNSDLSKNSSEFHLKSFNTFSFTTTNNERRYDEDDTGFMNDVKILNCNKDDLGDYQFVCFNISNLQNNAVFRDEWFIGGSYVEILNKLQQPNAILVPIYMLDKNFSINDQVNLYFTNEKDEKVYRNVTIIGAYNKFPVCTDRVYYDDGSGYISINTEIIVNPQVLENATLKKATYLFYGDGDLNATHIYQLKNLFYRNFPLDFSISSYFSSSDDLETEYDAIQFKFIKLESVLFVLYMVIGVFFHSTLSNMKSSYEIGLLKSRGVSKKDLLKLSLSEIHLILVIGFIFSSISLIGIRLLMTFLNLIRSTDIGSLVFIYYQQPKIIDLIGIIVGTILFYITYFSLNYLQIIKSSANRDLEKILRIN